MYSVYDDELQKEDHTNLHNNINENINEDKESKEGKKEKEAEKGGRWTKEEHELFLEALEKYGKDWKKVQMHVGTRTTTQARSHAQKHFAKLDKLYAKSRSKVTGEVYREEGAGILTQSSSPTVSLVPHDTESKKTKRRRKRSAKNQEIMEEKKNDCLLPEEMSFRINKESLNEPIDYSKSGLFSQNDWENNSYITKNHRRHSISEQEDRYLNDIQIGNPQLLDLSPVEPRNAPENTREENTKIYSVDFSDISSILQKFK